MSQHESLGDLEPQARVIAFYLPQFHPMKENDEWWEPGFTEWTQVTRARPLFRGHQQPQLPSELGFYDLRVPETREQQASLARECGIEGFCYWHYWLGNGRRLLERPFEDVLSSGQPDFPFCLAWANHDWSGTAFGAGRRLLAKQLYPGFEDYLAHFKFLARAFADSRYIRVNGKPLFYIYRPHEIPDCKKVMEFFREQAEKVGHKGLYLVGETASGGKAEKYGLDAGHLSRHRQISLDDKREPSTVNRAFKKLKRLTGVGIASLADDPIQRYDYGEAMKVVIKDRYLANEYPSIVSNWDTTPRFGRDAVVFENATPEAFRNHLKEALSKVDERPFENRLLFLRAWNEWAEGNYMEPDVAYGRQRLEVLKEELMTRRAVVSKMGESLSSESSS